MKRYYTLIAQYIRTSLIREMEFRSQFILSMVLNGAWVITMFLVANIFFFNTTEIAGWNKQEVYILIVCWSIIHETFATFFRDSLNRLSQIIRDGSLDTLLTKPLPLIAQLAFSRFAPAAALQLAFQWILLIVFVNRFDIGVSAFEWSLFSITLICGVLVDFSVFLGLQAIAFWVADPGDLRVMYFNVVDIGRYPMRIYKNLQPLFYTLLPLAYIGYVQAQFIIGQGSLPLFATVVFITLISAVSVTLLVRAGSKNYSSASS